MCSDMKVNKNKSAFWTFPEPQISSDPALTPDLFPDGWILWRKHGAIEAERPLVDKGGTIALISGEKKTTCIFQVDYHPGK